MNNNLIRVTEAVRKLNKHFYGEFSLRYISDKEFYVLFGEKIVWNNSIVVEGSLEDYLECNSGESLEDLELEAAPYVNTLVLQGLTLKLLKGVHESSIDGEHCWLTYDVKGELNSSSCVMGWLPLKGFMKNEHYTELVNHWNFNCEQQAN